MFGESFVNLVKNEFPQAKIRPCLYYDDMRIKGYHIVFNRVTFSVQFGPGSYNDCPLYPNDEYDFTKCNTAECAFWVSDNDIDWDKSIRCHLDMWDCILYMLDVFEV